MLKFRIHPVYKLVALLVSAWIEIHGTSPQRSGVSVALLVSAWIEIALLIRLINEVKRLADSPTIVEIDIDGKRITKELATPMRKEFEKYDVNQAIITKGRR